MKMSTEQYDTLCVGIDSELGRANLSRKAIVSRRDCWNLFTRWTNRVEEIRPIGFGTFRDWIFEGLDDCHIDTAFRKMMREVGKTI